MLRIVARHCALQTSSSPLQVRITYSLKNKPSELHEAVCMNKNHTEVDKDRSKDKAQQRTDPKIIYDFELYSASDGNIMDL